MDRCVGAAARLPGGDHEDLAIQTLARSETVNDLAARHGVSRKFVYQQAPAWCMDRLVGAEKLGRVEGHFLS